MAQIPIYNQQVAPPHKPPPPRPSPISIKAAAARIKGAEAQARGAFGEQLQKIGSAFAGKLFDLAAKNEVGDALITASWRWQKFGRELQEDPEYAAYGDKFRTFYEGLREDLVGAAKLPRSKKEIEGRLEALRVDWGGQIQSFSDKRAIDDALTVLLRGINTDILNRDAGALNARITEAIAGGVVSQKDGEHMQQMAAVQIQANTLGFPGAVLWLSTEEPTAQFGISREERLSLLSQYRSEWAVLREQGHTALTEAVEKTELEFLDRLQKGSPPSWEEIRDSLLPRERKEHFRNLLNVFTDKELKAEEKRLEEERAERERIQKELEEKKLSEAYAKAYAELVDYPLNQEEAWEDRILSDDLLTTKEKEHFIDEYRQRAKAAQSAAKIPTAWEITDDLVLAEVVRKFYDTEVSNDELKAFIREKHGYGLSNADVKTWLDKLGSRRPYYTEKLAVEMLTGFYDNLLRYEEREARIMEMRVEEAQLLKELADTIGRGELTEQGVLEYAVNLLAGSKQRQVRRAVQKLTVPEPERKPESPEEQHRKEIIERFTEWKGAPPREIGTVEGELAFFDGVTWYRYHRRAWQKWDGKTWATIK